MTRRFNTAGPNRPELHDTVDVTRRIQGIRKLTDDPFYVVIHAGRQVGKSTAMMALAENSHREGFYAMVLVSAEPGPPASMSIGAGEQALLAHWTRTVAQRFRRELTILRRMSKLHA